jgi:hypothetical protein
MKRIEYLWLSDFLYDQKDLFETFMAGKIEEKRFEEFYERVQRSLANFCRDAEIVES